MSDCLFCKIANKELDTNLIYEDDDIIAFSDINPQAPEHKLIVPRKHITTLNDLEATDNALIGHMIYTAQQLAKKLELADDGYRVLFNCNQAGGQAVFHIHLHLLGGRQMTWPPG